MVKQDGKLHMLKKIDDVRHHHWVLCEHQKMTELAVEETNQALSCIGWDPFQLPHKKAKPYPWLQLSQGRLEEEMSTLSKARAARIRSLTERGTPGSKAFFLSLFPMILGCLSRHLRVSCHEERWCLLHRQDLGSPSQWYLKPMNVVGTYACPLVLLTALDHHLGFMLM